MKKIFLAVAVVFLTTACSNDIPVTGVMLDRHIVTLRAGQSITLNATIRPNNASEQAVFWVTQHYWDSRITVSQDGVVNVSPSIWSGTWQQQITTRVAVLTKCGGHRAEAEVRIVR